MYDSKYCWDLLDRSDYEDDKESDIIKKMEIYEESKIRKNILEKLLKH